jgi:TolB-like protein
MLLAVLAVTWSLTMPTAIAEENPLLAGAKDLTLQISETYKATASKSKPKIAVLEFSDLNGRVTDFGRLLSEELITRLFLTRKFDVVERMMLNKVIQEHKLQMEGLVDPNSAKELGMILGVDAIVSGTCAETGSGVRVNARVVSTETGSVFAVASTTVASGTTATFGTSLSRPGVIYSEDFSGIEPGHLPGGWLGSSEIMVTKSGARREKVLSAEPAGSYQVVIPTGPVPEEFRLRLRVEQKQIHAPPLWTSKGAPLTVIVGDLTFTVDTKGVVKCGKHRGRFPATQGMLAVLVFEREDDIVRVKVNGSEALLMRIPEFSSAEAVTLQWKKQHDPHYGYNNLVLYDVHLERL